jgi:hypothetical protein
MKTKLLLSYLFILGVFCTYANTGKYRLILVDDPATTMTVGWDQLLGSVTSATVHYGTVDHGINYLSYAFSKTVDRTIGHRGMNNHFARLTGLTANTNYYFVLHDNEGTSQRFWFRTAPDDNSRLSFIAGGDSRNNRAPRQRANRLVSKLKPHAVLFGGDMTDTNSATEWQEWFEDWQLTIASDGRIFPIIPARGNHETNQNTIYLLFDTPIANSYYAVTFGDDLIRAYTLNSEISVLGDQLTWLQADLAASSGLTWKMAQYHKPMRPHTSNKAENNNQYNAWAELFYDEGVRLVVDCDSHMAKTTWPVKPSSEPGNDEGFVVDQTNGTVYTGEGCWGAPLRPNNDDKSWTRNSGSFNQFKLIFVEPSKIELRTIDVNNEASVIELATANTDPFTLPSNLDIFSPSTGAVVTISNTVDSTCPAAESPCDDGNTATIYDEEDGACNCNGLLNENLNELITNVATSSDDAEEALSNGVIDLTSSDLELINDVTPSTGNQVVGIRFDNMQLPLGAIIERAYIQFETDETDSALDPTNLVIHGELSPASLTFSQTNKISTRPLTTNSVLWSDIKKWAKVGQSLYNQKTPNLKTITEEIITQPGWNTGNAITYVISGSGRRIAESFDGTQAPILRIIYRYDCPIDSLEVGALGACDSMTDTYSQDIIINHTDAPVTGTLNVNGQSFAIGSSPQTVTLTGLSADGFAVDVSAYFTADPTCVLTEEGFYEAPTKCSNGGIPDNSANDMLNLALATDASLSGSVLSGRGTVETILYDPSISAYHIVSDWNEYGVNFLESIGTPEIDDGFKWQANWQNVKYINYITFGGAYPNQPQPNTKWRISYRKDGIWIILDEGTGGWVDDGIFEWGGAGFNPIEADALRVQLYSDGSNDLESVHLRARGGISNSINDSSTATKATLIQYLAPGNNCGVNIPSGAILYCGGDWIYSDGPDETSGTKNTIIADGIYIIDIDQDVEVNNLEISIGATVIIKEGASITVKGNLINKGTLELESISTKYSSLIVEGTSTGDVLYKRHVNSAAGASTSTGSNDLISAPVSGQNFFDFRTANPNILSGLIGGNIKYLFGPFNPVTTSYTLYSSANDSNTLDAGVGYRSGSTNGDTYTFKGTLETGPISVPITAGGASNWNLIGNPYPSYLKVQDFLNNMSNSGLIDENAVGIYGYDGTAADGWVIYNLATTTVNTIITPGQGFFVDAETSGSISFTPSMRSKGSGDDFIANRNANVLTYLKLKINANDKTYHTDFYFNSNAGDGLDPGYDASVWNDVPPNFAVYSHLVQDNTGIAMALQALNVNDLANSVVSLGVNASANEALTFSLLESTLPSSVSVYIEDTEANTVTLLNSNNYSITPRRNISGAGRFFLRFESDALSTIEQPLEDLNIYTNTIQKTIVIDGQLQSKTNLNLYDISGRLVKSQALDVTNTNQSISIVQFSTGIYIVELITDANQKRIKKLIIK